MSDRDELTRTVCYVMLNVSPTVASLRSVTTGGAITLGSVNCLTLTVW